MKMEVAVVILNYNGQAYLEQFLPSVIAHSEMARIWVVDNCSTDDSVAFVKDNYPSIKLLVNQQNGGFAQGYNEGLEQIEADYYVLLNSDVEVTKNWLEPCIDLLEKNENIAAVQPKILAQKRKDYFEHAGAAGGFIDSNYYPFCRGRIFDLVEKDEGQYNESTEIFWATGACMVVRAKLYHKNGGLDADFFAHMEEIDFCWRLKKQGHQIFYCGDAHVFHVGGGTLDYQNPRKTHLNFRNSLYMIYKNHDGILFFKLFYRLCLDGIAAAVFLFKFQFAHFWAVFKAHLVFYITIPKLHKKRSLIKKNSTTFNSAGLYKKNIIFKKFISGLKKFSELKSTDFN